MLKDGVHCVSGVRHELFVSQKICIVWPNTKEEKIKKNINWEFNERIKIFILFVDLVC